MEFTFSEDQLLLQSTVRDFLASECTPEFVRAQWESETGRSHEFWGQLAEIGIPGLLVPEDQGGLGMDELDFVLLLEEVGRAALAEPVLSTAFVGVPLLRGLPDGALDGRWLERVANGEAILAVGHPVNAFTSDAHVADLLLLPDPKGDEIHALTRDQVKVIPQDCNDPSRRIFELAWSPTSETRLVAGAEARALLAAALDRGALACAAGQLGVGQQLIDMAVLYATQRKQFGVAIGTFQAIKHALAEVKVRVEYARSGVYRAAHSLARGSEDRATVVSMAKVAASEAALQAAKVALQVHGAIGYTYEQDLHIWMRRAWSYDLAWGDTPWHLARVAGRILDDDTSAPTFGYDAAA
jgi:alkylation response protein AidB-like acyl-CoA dehydrogenase